MEYVKKYNLMVILKTKTFLIQSNLSIKIATNMISKVLIITENNDIINCYCGYYELMKVQINLCTLISIGLGFFCYRHIQV